MPDICTNPLLKGRGKRMYIINQYLGVEGKILITMIPTAGFVAGINLTFASGTITIDWKDGSSTENFVSGVELTHTYTLAGTYIAEITGNLSNITALIAPSSRISTIANLKTGLLTQLTLNTNSYSGALSLLSSKVSGTVNIGINSGLTSVNFATSGNGTVDNFVGYLCGYSSLDFTDVPIGGIFFAYIMAGFNSLTFAASGNSALTDFRVYNTGVSNIDFSVFPNSDGVSIRVSGNSWTATEHDNQLINLDATGWVNGSLNIITGNTARTAASDTAYNNLIANGWTIT